MRYLIVGLGFIATHIALRLSQYKDTSSVTVTYRSLNPVKEEYVKLLKGRVDVVKADPMDEQFRKLVRDSDTVVNLVGEISGSEETLRRANVEVPTALARMSAKEGKQFIHFSGATSTGATGTNVRVEQEHCKGVSPTTTFEITKCQGERSVMNETEKEGTPLAILRPTLVYGRYAAHVQFVSMYRLAKVGLLPKLGLLMATVNADWLGDAVRSLSQKRPRRLFVYASECGTVPVSRFFQLMAESLKRRGIQLPVPLGIAKAFLPKDIRALLRYSRTSYDCQPFKEISGHSEFDPEEVRLNALFLRDLEKEGKLIPT